MNSRATTMVALGLAGVTAGVYALARPAGPADGGALPPAAVGPPSAAVGAPAPSPPSEIRGARGLRAVVVPVAAGRDGALALPEDARTGGWWALGAMAGAAEGTTLIAGHVDTRGSGPGAFAALHGLAPGARVELVAANGLTYPYVIAARRLYDRQALPAELFGRSGAHRLALVTCAGNYDPDKRAYDANLVLYATPLGGPLRPRGES
ncbi:class F sortase [Streptomyces sp. NPDC053755]|uniref:class F sortase n=1 Tax=Streptomyces sp. NPDC053755 TaxID=3155815 RepID=UPI003422CE82